MTDRAILEAIDHMLTMQASVLTSVAQLCCAITTKTAAQDAMDEAETHALWVDQWRERHILSGNNTPLNDLATVAPDTIIPNDSP